MGLRYGLLVKVWEGKRKNTETKFLLRVVLEVFTAYKYYLRAFNKKKLKSRVFARLFCALESSQSLTNADNIGSYFSAFKLIQAFSRILQDNIQKVVN